MPMQIDLHVFIHSVPAATAQPDPRIDAIINTLKTIAERQQHTMKELDDLTEQVTENVTLDGSIAQLLTNIAAELAAAKTEPAALAALAERLKTSAAVVSAAIVANTPAAPPAA